MAGIDQSDWGTTQYRIERLEQRTDKLEVHIEQLERGVSDLSREVAILHKAVEEQGRMVAVQLESVSHELSKFRADFDAHGMEEIARFMSMAKYAVGFFTTLILSLGSYIWMSNHP